MHFNNNNNGILFQNRPIPDKVQNIKTYDDDFDYTRMQRKGETTKYETT